MLKIVSLASLLSLLALAQAPSAHAWSEHFRITRQALSTLRMFDTKRVTPTSFQAVLAQAPAILKDLGYDPAKSFNETIQIHKNFRYEFRAGEVEGQPVSIVDVLSTYSDEPDWNMDKELFGEDQYPDLWKDEYVMMGGKEGTPSQSFRHMFWSSIRFTAPLSSLHLPPNTIFRSMGTANERARVFVTLARAAAKLPGLEYWSVRFLANALHYLEDISQPFHASQIPYISYLTLPVFDRELGDGGKELVKEVTNIVSYYHFAFEDYIAYAMRTAADGSGGPETHAIVDALITAPKPRAMKGIDYTDRNPERLIEEMSKKSVSRADDAGKASQKFFPPITVKYAELNAQNTINDAWWAETIARGQSDSDEKRKYFKTVTEMFGLLGESVRRIVAAELPATAR